MNGPVRSPSLRDWLPVLGLVWLVAFCLYFFSLDLPNSFRKLARLDIWALLPELIQLDLFPISSDDLPSGWGYLSQRIPVALPALLILAGAFALGRLTLRGLNLLKQFDGPAGWALSGGVGLSLWSVVTLLLGLSGLLFQGLFITLLVSLVAGEGYLTIRGASGNGALSAPSPQSSGEWGKGEGARGHAADSAPHSRGALLRCAPYVAIMLLFLGPMALGALLPETDFDVKEYHLQGPKEYLEQGRITFLPHNVYTSFPFLTEMLSLSGMVVYGGWEMGALTGKLILMAFAPLTALGAFAMVRQLAGERAGWLAALFYLSTPWAYRISIIAYTEGAMCCYVMLTLLAVHQFGRGLDPEDQETGVRNSAGAWWTMYARELIVGIVAGSAASTKYPGLVFVTIPALLAVLLLRTSRSSTSISYAARQSVGSVLACGAGVLIAFGPWLAKNLVETGNPVYPLAWSVFGGTDWDEQMDAKWKRAHGPPAGRFTNPRMLATRVIDVAAQADWQSPLLVGFAPCAFLAAGRRRWLWISAGYALFVFAGWYGLTHHLDRFWLPILPPLTVLAGIGAHALWSRLNDLMNSDDGALRMAGGIGSLIAPGVTLAVLLFNAVFITMPECGPNAYLLDYKAALRETTTPSIDLAEEVLPENSKVLFVGEAAVFNAHFPLRYNTVFDTELIEEWSVDASRKSSNDPFPLLPAADIAANLRAAGITHVFVNWWEVLRYRVPSSYGFTNFVSPARLRELVEAKILEPVPLQPEQRYELWEGVDAEKQQEVLRWAPELKEAVNGYEALRKYDAYAVTTPQRP